MTGGDLNVAELRTGSSRSESFRNWQETGVKTVGQADSIRVMGDTLSTPPI